MFQHDWLTPLGIGCLFILLGLAAIFRGRSEEKRYYDSLASRTDVREFVERPQHPQFEALKIGGWIAITIGVLMVVTGFVLLPRG